MHFNNGSCGVVKDLIDSLKIFRRNFEKGSRLVQELLFKGVINVRRGTVKDNPKMTSFRDSQDL